MGNELNGVGASGKKQAQAQKQIRKQNRQRDRAAWASLAAVVNAVMLSGTFRASAEEPAASNTSLPPADASTLQEVVVTAKPEGSYQVNESANGKYTEPLLDTPQTITVIPQALMKDQNASTLREALQNVPGITFQAGEGGTLAGDNIMIRGYNARDDIFVNGFRDTGVYNRDPFDLEQIEVVKGPASVYSGHGSTGGSVNLITKEANLTPSYQASTGFGTDQYYRDTIDINQPLGQLGSGWETTSFRLNAMYQYNEHSERDDVYESRWGIDPTLTWGLGTDTKVTVDYFHQQEFNLPSYGIPTVRPTDVPTVAATNPSQLSRVGNVANVPFSNFYGLVNRDYQKTYTDIPTVTVSHDFGDELKLENTTRYERTFSEQIASSPRFEPGVIPPADAIPGGVLPPLQPGNVAIEQRGRRQIDSLFGDQTQFTGKFDTWSFQHDWVFTLEASQEKENAQTTVGNGASNPPIQLSLLSPDSFTPYPFAATFGPETQATLNDFAFSLFDSIKLDPHWILSGGMRFDHADSIQTGGGLPDLSRTDDLPSYRAALTYKPIEPVSIYFGYGTSYNLSIEGTASDTGSPDGLTVASAGLAPEKNTTYEFGTKWDALQNRLSLGAAFFRTTKENTRITDPVTGDVTDAGTSRVQGIELSVAGNLTQDWKVFGGYSYMQSEILSSPATTTVGNRLPNVPEQSASLWTTYSLPAHVTVGTGAVFVDQRFATTAEQWGANGYWTQAAMVSYKPEKWLEFQVNVSNLWDEHYIFATGSNSIPGDGRSVVFTTSVKF